MQTWITDSNFYRSASNLDIKRLGANVYESIQILASLLDCTDKLVNPKRNIKNYPQAKLWKGYEPELYTYIFEHIIKWIDIGYRFIDTITEKNINIIYNKLINNFNNNCLFNLNKLDWITIELIETHRSVLIQKNPKHYKKLWSYTPDNLKMRYDWRDK